MEEPGTRKQGVYGRRSVLLGAAGAFAAWLGRAADPARADDGNPVRLGRRNESTSPTRIVNSTESKTTLRPRASGSGGVAIEGVSAGGTGVHGLSRTGNGVQGESVFGIGLSGHSIEPGSTAISGDSTDGVGVQGGSHTSVGVQGNSQLGVAVRGGNVSETEPAIQGWAQNGQTGIMGRSTAFDEFDPLASPRHVGVFGVSDRVGGRGVLARSREGWAIQASGRVRFSTSGMVSVPVGSSKVTVKPSFPVVASAKVLATLQADPASGATVRFVSIDPVGNTSTVHLTEPAAKATPVAWFVLD